MSRKFRYQAEPGKVRDYVENLGWRTEERYNREGTRATGFTIQDTTVELSYDQPIFDPVTGNIVATGNGLITLWEGSVDTGGDQEKLDRSRELYSKLYMRFRKH